jgi:hypothetical protein
MSVILALGMGGMLGVGVSALGLKLVLSLMAPRK